MEKGKLALTECLIIPDGKAGRKALEEGLGDEIRLIKDALDEQLKQTSLIEPKVTKNLLKKS